jgi:hypothetical protein
MNMPAGLVKNPLALTEVLPTLLVLAGGTLLALALARTPLSARVGDTQPLRRTMQAVGRGLEGGDRFARRWTSASIVMIVLVLLFVGTFVTRAVA